MKKQKKSFRQFIKPSELKKYFEHEMIFTDNKLKRVKMYSSCFLITVHSVEHKEYKTHSISDLPNAKLTGVYLSAKNYLVANYTVGIKEIETIKFTIDWYNNQNNESVKQGKPISYPEIKLISK